MSKYVEIYEVMYRTKTNEIKQACLGLYINETKRLIDVLTEYDSSAVYIINSKFVG